MIQHGYPPRHVERKDTHQSRWSRQLAAAFAVGLALVASVAFATPASAAPSQVVVRSGDQLGQISLHYCGQVEKYRNLAAGNGIRNANLIYPGQVIKLTCNAPLTSVPKASTGTTRTTSIPAGGWVSPLAKYSLTSCFGMRWGAMHQGIDMAAPTGTPIRAAHAGVVTKAGWVWHGYGISVVINNGGVWTHGAHMSRLNVRVGQTVAAGEVIGYVGATGNVTGPHLHFEVARSAGVLGAQQNPASFLRAHGVNVGGC